MAFRSLGIEQRRIEIREIKNSVRSIIKALYRPSGAISLETSRHAFKAAFHSLKYLFTFGFDRLFSD